MSKVFDIRPVGTALYFLPVETRIPLKFGPEILTSVTVARVRLHVRNRQGKDFYGWGETPLSVQWVWHSAIPYSERHAALKDFTLLLAKAWADFNYFGHPMEVGYAFQEKILPNLLDEFNKTQRSGREPMPWLAALVSCSLFDIALHDAYGISVDLPVYHTYNPEYMNRDLSAFIEPAKDSQVDFKGLYPQDFLVLPAPTSLPVWHLVGGVDLLDASELKGDEPQDGYPVLLSDWIHRDGIKCLKVKLRGDNQTWDYQRLVRVGEIAIKEGVDWLTSDFNCTVTNPAYVNEILDKLVIEHPRIYGMILYVEQPFPYELEENLIDVHSVSARKPLFMDESAHDWKLIRLGRKLGWTGVALKSCKTQTGALLSLCWAKAHGMTLMVQDLTNPMIAIIPHVLLATHAGTIMGVECNAAQFYPDASTYEARVHPGLYERRNGHVDLSTIQGAGFGYRLFAINRPLPNPVFVAGDDEE